MLVTAMVRRILLSALLLALPGGAGAGQILLPSGPFEMQLPVQSPCVRQAPRQNQDLPCVPQVTGAVDDAALVQSAVDRAEGYVFHRRTELAEAEIQAALERHPKAAALWHVTARLHLAAGRHDQARAAIEKAVALDPRDGDALATAAYLTAMSGEMRAALAGYDQALAYAPANQFALTQSVYLSEHLGDPAAISRAIDRLAAHWPEHPVALGRAIDRALRSGDVRAALDKAEAMDKLGRGTLPTRIRLVEILQLANEHARAVTVLGELLGREGGRPRFIMDPVTRAKLTLTRALSHKALRQFEEARRDVEETLKAADANLLLRIGIFLVSNGFEDLRVSNTHTPDLESAAVACIQNPACGFGLTQKI